MGMDPNTGAYRPLEAVDIWDARAQLMGNEVLVEGTAAEVAAMSQRIRLGNRELENRKARRAQQKRSRRNNRG